jgi:ABC-type sugar transport system permease subunit
MRLSARWIGMWIEYWKNGAGYWRAEWFHDQCRTSCRPECVGFSIAGVAADRRVLLPAGTAAALLLSFTDFDIYALGDLNRLRFVGLANYGQLLQSPLFWTALGNTLYFVVVGGPLSVAVSLGAALLVNSRLTRFPGLFRTAFFLPVVTTLVAVAMVWRYLYHPRYGLMNYGLSWLGIEPIDWLGDPVWAMPAIILMAVWKNFGFNMIIFIAGLQNIPTPALRSGAD